MPSQSTAIKPGTEEIADEVIVEACPDCGAYPLQKTKTGGMDDEETVFVDNCPNCSYRKRF